MLVIIFADFPPNSKATGLRPLLALAAIIEPVEVPPVNETTSIPGCFTRASPVIFPFPLIDKSSFYSAQYFYNFG